MFVFSALLGIGSLATAIGALAMPAPRGPVIVSPPRAAGHGSVKTSGTCPKNVIFVADSGNNVVDVFPLKGKNQSPCGQVSGGFSGPQGVAVDTQRQLYVANTNDSNIPVYAGPFPSGTLARTIADPGFFPAGVAVSEPDGLVAAMNICSAPSCGAGGIAIYKKNATTPCAVVNASGGFYRIYFGAFDAHDNVYVDGANASGGPVFGEVTGGCNAKTFTPITISNVSFPGFVGADKGGNILVGDEETGDIAVFAPGDFNTPLFTLTLQGGSASSCAFIASGKRLWCSGASSGGALEFKYPKGGAPVGQLNGPIEPGGIAVSPPLVPGG